MSRSDRTPILWLTHLCSRLTIINSTIAVGTTRAIAAQACSAVVNSPVRGKHTRMLEDLRMYTKFIRSIAQESGERAAMHFESMGMKTKVLCSPEASELAKLTETTYFGLLVAWAQEVERYCDEFGQNYEQVVSFYEEIRCLPVVKYFPGNIGGHCVMPNIEILKKQTRLVLLDAIQASNEMKIRRDEHVNSPASDGVARVLSASRT